MNLSEIQELIKLVSKSNLSKVEIEKKDFKITLKSEKNKKDEPQQPVIIQAAPQMPMAAAPMMPAAPVAQAPAPAVAPAAPAAEAPAQEDNYITVKSPMPGTFYRASAPDKDPFVQVGTTIQKGDTVCIIEAMKLFNEIEAEVSGKIVKVLVDDASPIEYDQPLFLVEPA